VTVAEILPFVRADGRQDRYLPRPLLNKVSHIGVREAADSQVSFKIVEPKDTWPCGLRSRDRSSEGIGMLRFHAGVPGQAGAHRLVGKAGLPRGGVTHDQHEAAGDERRRQFAQPIACYERRHLIDPPVHRLRRGGWVHPKPDGIGDVRNPAIDRTALGPSNRPWFGRRGDSGPARRWQPLSRPPPPRSRRRQCRCKRGQPLPGLRSRQQPP
jgi:hypothetical protein